MNASAQTPLHMHFNSRSASHPVFHMTDALIGDALSRRPDLAGKVRYTTDWDLKNGPRLLETASVLVTSMQVPRDRLGEIAPRLRSIHFIGAGIEYLRPMDWLPKNVVITNNRGIHQQKAGEHILMCILLLNSRVPSLMNAQARHEWLPLYTGQAKGKTLLIIGAGQLGGAGAKEAKRMGLHVIGVRRSARPHRYCDEVVGLDQLHSVLPRADFVVVSAPSTAQTDGMIGEREFALMKSTAGFVNFARARLVDYNALAKVLREGKLGGAILDVFDPEPLPADSFLWETPNLLITPHCSSDDLELYLPMTLDLVFDNVARMLAGRQLRNRVNLRREY